MDTTAWVVLAIVGVTAVYLALMCLVGRCLNLHGEPPRNRTDERK